MYKITGLRHAHSAKLARDIAEDAIRQRHAEHALIVEIETGAL